jgi:hypothetical protein
MEDIIRKVQKALALAGANPTTPEQLAAYNMARQLLRKLEAQKKPPTIQAQGTPGLPGGGPIVTITTKQQTIETMRQRLEEFVAWYKSQQEKAKKAAAATKRVIVRGAKKVYDKDPDDFVVYEITPTTSVRNNQAYVLAKVMASFYRKPSELRRWGKPWCKGDRLLTTRDPYRCNFRIVMRGNEVAFYLLLPREKAGEILRKAEAIYDSGITIKEVGLLPKLDPVRTFCAELNYRRHPIFSLATDRDNNYPLPSLLTAVRTLEGDDCAVFDVMLEPYARLDWYKEAKDAHRLLEKGYVPNNSAAAKVFRLINDAFHKLRYEILEVTRFTKKQKEALEKWRKEEGQYREAALLRDNMQPTTKRKQDDEILKAWLRIAVQSDDPYRRRDVAYTIANAWKDISGDNELERTDVPPKWTARYLKAIETRKGFSITFNTPKVSVEEAGKMLQLPGRSLIEEFPQIKNKSMKEVSLPAELIQYDKKHIRVGYVTERGQKKLAVLPLEAYELEGHKVLLKAVYDAVCTSTFGQGKQGSGKSEGFGTVTAYDMVMAGFTAIIIDTADGQVLRNFVNSLPADYPEEKIHALNLDNKAYPMPLDWSDIYGRSFTAADGDDELASLEISERLTSRFIGFINSLKDTGEEFTDRMTQYLTSCMRAITTRNRWSFLDLELALTSPAYREELLQLQQVKDQPDVVRDLEALQEKALDGKDRSITDPIIARLKVLSGSQFMTNLFFQDPKLDENGKPTLDLRRIMDNPEGGYGHVVVVQASFDAWQEAQATILGFFEDKINFNAFSRIDQDQADRKPVLKWIDEPHKVIKAIQGRLAGTSVEFRKYRVKNLFTGHSIDQMGAAADALLDGGAQITSYKTERLSELSRFAHSFKPYDDAKALYEALPDKHTAINKIRLPSGKASPAFIADMVAPPNEVKDRSHVWHESARRYGRPWKEVRAAIHERRTHYQDLDETWIEEQKNAKKAARKSAK